jgi:hypothetical protein
VSIDKHSGSHSNGLGHREGLASGWRDWARRISSPPLDCGAQPAFPGAKSQATAFCCVSGWAKRTSYALCHVGKQPTSSAAFLQNVALATCILCAFQGQSGFPVLRTSTPPHRAHAFITTERMVALARQSPQSDPSETPALSLSQKQPSLLYASCGTAYHRGLLLRFLHLLQRSYAWRVHDRLNITTSALCGASSRLLFSHGSDSSTGVDSCTHSDRPQ